MAWLGTVYKKLAASELGIRSHTSGIVPSTGTQDFFTKEMEKKSGETKVLVVEFWDDNNNVTIIKTNVNYHLTKTHNHPHISGNILPAYKSAGAKVGDLILFWKSVENPNIFKAKLVKQDTKYWDKIQGNRLGVGGFINNLPPPGKETEEIEENYQTEYQVDTELNDDYFPPIKRISSIRETGAKYFPRNKAKGDYVLKKNDYKCQLNPNHKTFITRLGNPYVEKHHLIPIEFYEDFEYNIDDINNIISLCPICHRKIHYAEKIEAEKILYRLWKKQKDKLKKANIFVDFETIKKMYSC